MRGRHPPRFSKHSPHFSARSDRCLVPVNICQPHAQRPREFQEDGGIEFVDWRGHGGSQGWDLGPLPGLSVDYDHGHQYWDCEGHHVPPTGYFVHDYDHGRGVEHYAPRGGEENRRGSWPHHRQGSRQQHHGSASSHRHRSSNESYCRASGPPPPGPAPYVRRQHRPLDYECPPELPDQRYLATPANSGPRSRPCRSVSQNQTPRNQSSTHHQSSIGRPTSQTPCDQSSTSGPAHPSNLSSMLRFNAMERLRETTNEPVRKRLRQEESLPCADEHPQDFSNNSSATRTNSLSVTIPRDVNLVSQEQDISSTRVLKDSTASTFVSSNSSVSSQSAPTARCRGGASVMDQEAPFSRISIPKEAQRSAAHKSQSAGSSVCKPTIEPVGMTRREESTGRRDGHLQDLSNNSSATRSSRLSITTPPDVNLVSQEQPSARVLKDCAASTFVSSNFSVSSQSAPITKCRGEASVMDQEAPLSRISGPKEAQRSAAHKNQSAGGSLSSALTSIVNAYGAMSPQDDSCNLQTERIPSTETVDPRKKVSISTSTGGTSPLSAMEAVSTTKSNHSGSVTPSLERRRVSQLDSVAQHPRSETSANSSRHSNKGVSSSSTSISSKSKEGPRNSSSDSASEPSKSSSKVTQIDSASNKSSMKISRNSTQQTSIKSSVSGPKSRGKSSDSGSGTRQTFKSGAPEVSKTQSSRQHSCSSKSKDEDKGERISKRDKHRPSDSLNHRSLEESGLLNPKFDKNFRIPKKQTLPNPLKNIENQSTTCLKDGASDKAPPTWLQKPSPRSSGKQGPVEKLLLRRNSPGSKGHWRIGNVDDNRQSARSESSKKSPTSCNGTENLRDVLEGRVNIQLAEEIRTAKGSSEDSRPKVKDKIELDRRRRSRRDSKRRKRRDDEDDEWTPRGRSRSRASSPSNSPVGVASRTRSRTRSRSPHHVSNLNVSGFSSRISDTESEDDGDGLRQVRQYVNCSINSQGHRSCSPAAREQLSSFLQEMKLKKALFSGNSPTWEHEAPPEELVDEVDRDASTPPLPIPRNNQEESEESNESTLSVATTPPLAQLSPVHINLVPTEQTNQDEQSHGAVSPLQLSPSPTILSAKTKKTQTVTSACSSSHVEQIFPDLRKEFEIIDNIKEQKPPADIEIIDLEDTPVTYMERFNKLESAARHLVDRIVDNFSLAFRAIHSYIADFKYYETKLKLRDRIDNHGVLKANFTSAINSYYFIIAESMGRLVPQSLSEEDLFSLLEQRWEYDNKDIRILRRDFHELTYLHEVINGLPCSMREEHMDSERTQTVVAVGLYKLQNRKKYYLEPSQPQSRTSKRPHGTVSLQDSSDMVQHLPALSSHGKEENAACSKSDLIPTSRTSSCDSGYHSSPPTEPAILHISAVYSCQHLPNPDTESS